MSDLFSLEEESLGQTDFWHLRPLNLNPIITFLTCNKNDRKRLEFGRSYLLDFSKKAICGLIFDDIDLLQPPNLFLLNIILSFCGMIPAF